MCVSKESARTVSELSMRMLNLKNKNNLKIIIRAELLLFVDQWLVKSYFGGMSYELILRW